jgi:hypothetical protein
VPVVPLVSNTIRPGFCGGGGKAESPVASSRSTSSQSGFSGAQTSRPRESVMRETTSVNSASCTSSSTPSRSATSRACRAENAVFSQIALMPSRDAANATISGER